jgi:hypothetical protein
MTDTKIAYKKYRELFKICMNQYRELYPKSNSPDGKRGSISRASSRFEMVYRLKGLQFEPTKKVDSTYFLLLKVNLYWFVYESFFTKDKPLITKKNYDITLEQDYNLTKYLNDVKTGLSGVLGKKKKKLYDYIKDILIPPASGGTETSLKNLINIDLSNWNFTELISIIYAIRNNFAHNGDAAFTGLDTEIKDKVLTLFVDFLENILLQIFIKLLEDNKTEVEKLILKKKIPTKI